MKQKFTITIADIEMSILSEGSADEVEAVVAKVDRRIRDICRQSQRISKNEAALLCALEFCAACDIAERDISRSDVDYEALKEENAKLAEACEKLADSYSRLEEKLAAQKERYEASAAAQKEKYEAAAATQKEKYEGRIEIMREKYEARINTLRARGDETKKPSLPRQIAMEISEDQPAPPASDSAEEASSSADTTPAVVSAQAPPSSSEAGATDAAESSDPKKEPRGKGKNKVGNMFELLTFNDV